MKLTKKEKLPKMNKKERDEALKPFEELKNKGFDTKKFEEKNFGKELVVNEENIQKYFNETTANDNPAKELFEKGDVRSKTELNKNQVSSVVKLKYLAKELSFPELDSIANDFMYCQMSLNRQSRKEFVETTKNTNENMQGGGFFNKFRGLFNGNQ